MQLNTTRYLLFRIGAWLVTGSVGFTVWQRVGGTWGAVSGMIVWMALDALLRGVLRKAPFAAPDVAVRTRPMLVAGVSLTAVGGAAILSSPALGGAASVVVMGAGVGALGVGTGLFVAWLEAVRARRDTLHLLSGLTRTPDETRK